MVNCRRAEWEFAIGFAYANRLEHKPIFLCDGSLLFWHLESKSRALKERFLSAYLGLLDEFYKARIPIAGYISLPKSKDLLGIVRNAQRHGMGPKGAFDMLVDTDLVGLFLKEGERTTVFMPMSSLAQEYPPALRPCFVYMHMGLEIARVEVPQWVAQDELLLNKVLGCIVDQAKKGNGYPVSLAEAHEQAVIKSHERYQFFSMLQKMHLKHNRPMPISQKSLKKRFVSI